MSNSLRIILSLLMVAIVTSNTHGQANAGDYLSFDNTVYFDQPSAIYLSFIKKNEETVSVLFSRRNIPKEMRNLVNDLESNFKNRLLRDGFTLKGPSSSTKNDIELWIDILNHDNHASYLVRLFVLRNLNYNESENWAKQSFTIWQRMYFGYGTKSNLKTKIRNNISDGLEQLIKELNTEL